MEAKLTPMLRQYMEIKDKYREEILFFRMGDFYEMFFDDARKASHALDIALTQRQDKVPMCGIPYHAAESYTARLIKNGFKVAVCEQMETVPSEGTIVKREVVRVITPGTVVEPSLIQSDENNFLGSVYISGNTMGMSFVDISTGDFFLSETPFTLDVFKSQMARFAPRELILKFDGKDDEDIVSLLQNRSIPINRINEWLYDTKYFENTIKSIYTLVNLKGLGIESPAEIMAAGSILEYLKDTQKKVIPHLKMPQRIVSREYMILDEAAISSLELVTSQQDRTKGRTLFSVLNNTRTGMGRRFLERAILQPLIAKSAINARLEVVEAFHADTALSGKTGDHLKNIQDIERIVSRLAMGKSFPRDLLSLSLSLDSSDGLKSLLSKSSSEPVTMLSFRLPDMSALGKKIAKTIKTDPALTPEQGRVINEGVSKELDRLYGLKTDGRNWVLQYESEEKTRLGIPTLKIRHNKIFGYYIEISKGQADKAPEDYLRKQTLVNCERFTTEKLQNFETELLTSVEKTVEIENGLLNELVEEVKSHREKLQELSAVIAEIDFFNSLAVSAMQNRFIKPVITEDGAMKITDGRHPVVEKYYTSEVFIPNDILFDPKEAVIKIITGPNMSGKSTYIRMAAVIQLMAQVGSFVPAAYAELSIVDRIFTRIGASDNISRGESTFLVEMNETATILNNATDRSLIIMDEVGRGTSTYDGLSLAWAIVEYILRYIKAKTLFATHYHELTGLDSQTGIVNYTVMVKESMHGVEFLHKVEPGAADKSYGIHVARLAGIPKEVTIKAQKLLDKLEKNKKISAADVKTPAANDSQEMQVELFNAANHLVIQAIKNINTDQITPLEALNELNRLKKIIE